MTSPVRIITRVDKPGIDSEELAAHPLGQGRFVIASIPFTDTDLALGDIVECVLVDGTWHVDRVALRGGNSTLRIVANTPMDLVSPLLDAGCRVEHGPAGLLGVSIGPEAPYLGLSAWLESLADDGVIDLAPGYTADRQ